MAGENNEAQEQETGDFGEGTGSLEEQLLNAFPEEGEEEEQAGEEEGEEAGEETSGEGSQRVAKSQPVSKAGQAEKQATGQAKTPVTPQSLFDANGKVTLKDGESIKITPELRQELERGQLRMADYTRKTQELSKIRNEAQDVLNAQAAIAKDPRNLFQYFQPSQILSAFTRSEMLAHGLNAGGVTPQVWNQFLEWFKESGGEAAEGAAPPKADPYSNQFQEFARRLENIERQNMTREEKARESEQQHAYEEQMSAYDKEVDGALKDFPAVNRRALLVEMAISDGSKTVKELAKDLSDKLESRFQEYLKTKNETKRKIVKRPKGSSVPVLPRRPKTFDEADEQIARLYGDGTLGTG